MAVSSKHYIIILSSGDWRLEAGAEGPSALVEMLTHVVFLLKSSHFFPGVPEVSSCARMHITLALLWELLGVCVKRSMHA